MSLSTIPLELKRSLTSVVLTSFFWSSEGETAASSSKYTSTRTVSLVVHAKNNAIYNLVDFLCKPTSLPSDVYMRVIISAILTYRANAEHGIDEILDSSMRKYEESVVALHFL